MLNEHTPFNITRELHLHKRWGKNTLLNQFQEFKKGKQTLDEFTLSLSKLQNASYWKSDDYSAQDFHKFLETKNLTPSNYQSLVTSILEYDKFRAAKKESGAKFPININSYPLFKKWYPNEHFIFLGRDPLTMAFSQFNKHKTNSFSKRIVMLLHVASMFNATILWGKIFKPKNSLFIRYESFKTNKEEVIKKVCQFLNIEFQKQMTDLPILGSRMQKNSNDFILKYWERILLKLLTFPFRSIYLKSN